MAGTRHLETLHRQHGLGSIRLTGKRPARHRFGGPHLTPVQEVRRVPKRTRTTVILAAAVACATGLGVSPAIAGTAAGALPPAAASSAPRQVTLVTGDVVTVSTQAGGRQTASVLR